jgi:hypothetical protein
MLMHFLDAGKVSIYENYIINKSMIFMLSNIYTHKGLTYLMEFHFSSGSLEV